MKTKQFLLKRMIQRYIHNHLINHLVAKNKGEYRVESIPTWLGTSKFFIKTDDRSVVARFYPFTKRRASRRFLNASRLVEKMGAPPSPRIIFSDFTKIYFGYAPHNYKPYWDSHKNFYYAWYCLDNAGGWAKKAVMVRESDYDSSVDLHKRARGLFEDMFLYIKGIE